jgi:hypothetical protein
MLIVAYRRRMLRVTWWEPNPIHRDGEMIQTREFIMPKTWEPVICR